MEPSENQESHKVGIIICHRYHRCGGGKCFRALRNREGAFERYQNQPVEVAAYATCDGCPGGNIEYVPEEMAKNGVQTVHFATGMIVGYPPCPYIEYFQSYIENRFGLEVVMGTHPIPEKYRINHEKLGSWNHGNWPEIIEPVMADEQTRLAYN